MEGSCTSGEGVVRGWGSCGCGSTGACLVLELGHEVLLVLELLQEEGLSLLLDRHELFLELQFPLPAHSLVLRLLGSLLCLSFVKVVELCPIRLDESVSHDGLGTLQSALRVLPLLVLHKAVGGAKLYVKDLREKRVENQTKRKRTESVHGRTKVKKEGSEGDSRGRICKSGI